MKILMLAPQPFFEERGTPIAVDMLLRGLSERGEQVDLLTYHLGKDIEYENVKINRIRKIPYINKVSPGFSFRKIICDFLMVFHAFGMAARKQYHYVHAVEESVFIAMLIKMIYKIPYIYDMDSRLSQQLVETNVLFTPLERILAWFEKLAIRHSTAVAPVCEAIYNQENDKPEKVVILKDVTLLKPLVDEENEDLRQVLGLQGILVMYVGNLEKYQGIDLLLESFQLALKTQQGIHLIIIGGKDEDIEYYRKLSSGYGIKKRVHFIGRRPVKQLGVYLAQADVLISPRIKGNNTPMKIYSYLHSGKALLATDIYSHTQVLTDKVAMLAKPTPEGISQSLLRLVQNPNLRKKLGREGKKYVEENHTWDVYREGLNDLYDWLALEEENNNGLHSELAQSPGSKKLDGQ
jgi:glycosyltransferase involved in cell wall biosynthesis